VSGSDDKTVKVWDIEGNGKLKATYFGHKGPVKCIACLSSSGRKFVASGSDDRTTRLWGTGPDQNKVLIGHTDSINSLALSPSDNPIASTSDKRAIVRYRDTGQRKFTLPHPGQANLVTFLGDKIATSFSNNSDEGSRPYHIWLWDANGDLYATLEGHNNLVTAIDISPSRGLVATASNDSIIQIWTLQKGESKLSLDKVKTYEPIRKLDFSKDGSYLQTDRGYLRSKILPSMDSYTSISELYLSTKWVTQGIVKPTNFIRIPDEYKPVQVHVDDEIAILGHASGNVSILKFDLLGSEAESSHSLSLPTAENRVNQEQ
jgi:WD40 repeat protein